MFLRIDKLPQIVEIFNRSFKNQKLSNDLKFLLFNLSVLHCVVLFSFGCRFPNTINVSMSRYLIIGQE